MTNDFLELIVKVGRTSTLSFSNVKAYRAISGADLINRVNNHSNCSAVIIENIRENELDEVKDFIKSFVVENEKYVWFYVKDNDDITCGLADELEYEIHLSEESLFKDIFNKTGRIITSNIKLRKELSVMSEDGDDPFDPFAVFEKQDDSGRFNINNTEEVSEVEHSELNKHENTQETNVEIKPTLTLEKQDSVVKLEEQLTEIDKDKEKEVVVKVVEKIVEVEVGKEKVERLQQELASLKEKSKSKQDDIDRLQKEIKGLKSELSAKSKQEEIEIAQREREIAILKAELSGTAEKQAETEKLLNEITTLKTEIKEYQGIKEELEELQGVRDELEEMKGVKEELEETRDELKDTKDELQEKEEKLQEMKLIKTELEELQGVRDELDELSKKHFELTEYANGRISELNKLNTMLKGKYNDIVKQYNEFMADTEVIEDPVSLEDYREIKIELSGVKGELETAQSKVKELLEANDESNRVIEQLENDLQTCSEKLVKHKEEIVSLNEQIELGAGNEQEIETLREKLRIAGEELEKTKKDSARSVEIANEEIRKLKNKIGTIGEQYEAEAYARRNLAEFADDIAIKYVDAIKLIDDLNAEIENQHNTIKGLKGDSDNIIISQGNDIKMLRQQIDLLAGEKDDLEHQILQDEDNLKKVREEYEMQIGMLREQVQFAESKYARLEQAAYVSDATQLAEQNKTLEDINMNLRNQLRLKSEEIERGTRERAELNSTIRKLNEDKAGLSSTIKTMTNGIQGGISQKIMIPKINYNGNNFIIPVFGSGSYGTTTTAMSLAYKFAENGSTLYIDFDLVSPKCDLWFKKPPLCEIPNSYDNGKEYCTSLGIFFEKGCRYFLDNYGHIVFNKIRDRSGTLDYLTGVYAKIDTYKFMSADFSTLLTSLGNTYKYVVIDMGRLGSSELTDAIISGITRAVCERGNRCVAVTTPNNIEIRNLRKKIMDVGIDISSVAWLVNMSRSNKIEEKAMKNIRPALAGTMQFDPDLYGCVQTFQEESRSRSKVLSQFISNCIYASR